MPDLSRLSDADFDALERGDVSSISDAGLAELEGQYAPQEMRDSVAVPNPNFEVAQRTAPVSELAMSARDVPILDGPQVDVVRAAFTNEPTQGVVESFIRAVPASAGALIATAPNVVAAPFTGGASFLSAPAQAAVGGAGGEGLRQVAAQLYSGVSGRPFTPPEDVAERMMLEGAAQGIAQIGVNALGAARRFIGARAPAAIEHYAGPREPLTKYVQERGASKVLTGARMESGAAESALEGAQEAVVTARRAAGKAVAKAEDAIIESGAADKIVDVSHITAKLSDAMEKRGFLGPDAQFADRDAKTLLALLGRLDKADTWSFGPGGVRRSGGLTGKEAINLRRFLDDMVDYQPGTVSQVGKTSERIIKDVANDLRQIINTEFTELGKANAKFSKVAGIYEKYRKFLGGANKPADEILGDANAIRQIRNAMIKNPKIPREAVAEFDEAIEGSGASLQEVFDSVAAREFGPDAPSRGAPSNILLKGAAAVGFTSPQLAGTALKAGESVGRFVQGPGGERLTNVARLGAASLADAYMRLRSSQ